MSGERRFPIQGESLRHHNIDGGHLVQIPSATVPWSVAELAYAVYAKKYGTDQSLERLAERGGFSRGELLFLLDGGTNEMLCTKVPRATLPVQEKANV